MYQGYAIEEPFSLQTVESGNHVDSQMEIFHHKLTTADQIPPPLELDEFSEVHQIFSKEVRALQCKNIPKSPERIVTSPVVVIDEKEWFREEFKNPWFLIYTLEELAKESHLKIKTNVTSEVPQDNFKLIEKIMLIKRSCDFRKIKEPRQLKEAENDFNNFLLLKIKSILDFFIDNYGKYTLVIKDISFSRFLNGCIKTLPNWYHKALQNAQIIIEPHTLDMVGAHYHNEPTEHNKLAPQADIFYFKNRDTDVIKPFLEKIRTGDIAQISLEEGETKIESVKLMLKKISPSYLPDFPEIVPQIIEKYQNLLHFFQSIKPIQTQTKQKIQKILLALTIERARIDTFSCLYENSISSEHDIHAALKEKIGYLDLFSYHEQSLDIRGLNFAKSNPKKSFISVGCEFAPGGRIKKQGNSKVFLLNYEALAFLERIPDDYVEVINIDVLLGTEKCSSNKLIQSVYRTLAQKGVASFYVDHTKTTQQDITKQLKSIGFDHVVFPPIKRNDCDYLHRRGHLKSHEIRVVAVKAKNNADYEKILRDYFQYEENC